MVNYIKYFLFLLCILFCIYQFLAFHDMRRQYVQLSRQSVQFAFDGLYFSRYVKAACKRFTPEDKFRFKVILLL